VARRSQTGDDTTPLGSYFAGADFETARTPLATQVVDGLRDMVLSGRLPPGTKLIQDQVAAELNVSRTPLREAIRVLVSEGLLTSIPSSGTVRVVALSAVEVEQLYQVREFIDGLAARLCAARELPGDTAEQLKDSVDRLARASSPFDLNAFVAAHAQFHAAILRSCGNHWLMQMEPLVRISAQMLFRQFASSGERMKKSIQEHRAILKAILAGDPAKAEELARAHICAASEFWVPRMQADQPS
jgi:DNA-binding GntR family transcriptional regulator